MKQTHVDAIKSSILCLYLGMSFAFDLILLLGFRLMKNPTWGYSLIESPFNLSGVIALPLPLQSINLEELREWQQGWLRQDLGVSEQCWEEVDNWQIPLFVERVSPECDEEGARLSCAWMTWLHLLDDQFDVPWVSHQPSIASERAKPFLGLLRAQSQQWPVSEQNGALLRGLVSLNELTVRGMSLSWRQRWFEDLAEFIGAYADEVLHRSSGQVPTPDDLIELKHICMCQRGAINLLERVLLQELSPAAMTLGRPYIDVVSDVTGAVNDWVSLPKEKAIGDTQNLLLSYVHHGKMTEMEALRKVVTWAESRWATLLNAIEVVPSQAASERDRQALRGWLIACAQWAYGYHQWVLDSGRFNDIVTPRLCESASYR